MDITYFVLFAILGLLIGSFLNVVILRLPHGQHLTGRSQCPRCKHVLGSAELIPVLSFVFQRGKCKHCRTTISPRYFIIELITAGLFGLVSLFFTSNGLIDWILLGRMLVVVACAIVIFVIDYEHFLILDSIVLIGSILVSALNLVHDIVASPGIFNSIFLHGLFGGISAFVVFYAVWFFSRGRWMGFGDVKFVGLMGLVLGVKLVWLAIVLACVIGSMVAIPLLLLGLKKMTSKIPFGTFLSVAWVFTALVGERILAWYLRLLGLY